MKKRDFLQVALIGSAAAYASFRLLKNSQGDTTGIVSNDTPNQPVSEVLMPDPQPVLLPDDGLVDLGKDLEDGFKHIERDVDVSTLKDEQIEDYLIKIRNFDADFSSDIYLNEDKSRILDATLARLERIETYVGHGNYNLLAFDDMLFYARNYEGIGPFSPQELNFMDEMFSADPTEYGFFGEKVIPTISHRITEQDAIKIPGSPHYLLKGESYNYFQRIYKDVGDRLLLTSGIRNMVKQMHLFLAKAQRSNYNLSKASRSLAPPGYSFHGIGDFDVGKIGLGELNFTSDFSLTEEYRRMISLGYIDIRYTDTNRFGVRYEPWHIKMT